ncbi:VrrA/YqfQ family protein [Neobacillus sp. DY30]|uniref:VrrA/YqfQ family protein n=1 Tax=Neobacillus sp. DY30 TaxID=3047871 RepID=UPI0024C0BB15|nr:VrrA/YqfQ family protein [Neobacillus sp. DY30]WHX99341.1 VrrA/YqfQ family protein [Neobacillus sp. DY30]
MYQPRPRLPLHGHMGANMMAPGPFGGQQHMVPPYGGYGPRIGYQQNYRTGGRPMMGQMAGRGQGRRNGGGLLSKILGGKKQGNQFSGPRGMQPANQAAQKGSRGVGSILQTLSNPDSLTGFLNNTQQVLKTAQSFGPMIQQYGPIVKNLPMMWRLYKGFKDLPTEEKSEPTQTENPLMEEQSIPVEKEPKRITKRDNNLENEPIAARKPHNGPSIPKLYI